MAAKKDHELPTKKRDLERAKIEAEKDLRDARADKARVADENELELRKLEAKLDDLERAIKELGGSLPPEPRKDEPKKEGEKKDAPKKDAPKKDAPKKDAPKNEQGAAKEDPKGSNAKEGAQPSDKPAAQSDGKPDPKPQDGQAPKADARS
jgi:hypothetical protein